MQHIWENIVEIIQNSNGNTTNLLRGRAGRVIFVVERTHKQIQIHNVQRELSTFAEPSFVFGVTFRVGSTNSCSFVPGCVWA